MRSLSMLIPMALLACGGGDPDSGLTIVIETDDTCPDTGCAGFVPAPVTMGGYFLWIDFAFDGDELVAPTLDYYPVDGSQVTAFFFDSNGQTACTAWWDITDFQTILPSGGPPTTGTTTGTTMMPVPPDDVFKFVGTFDGGNTDCTDGVVKDFGSADALAVFANMDATMSLYSELGPPFSYYYGAYEDEFIGMTLAAGTLEPVNLAVVSWEWDGKDFSPSSYSTRTEAEFFQNGYLLPGVFWAYDFGTYF